MKLQFMHLGTMLPHPRAAVPELALADATLVVPSGTQILDNVCSTLVYNDHAAIKVGYAINVFDWKKGKNLLVS
jgi:hypothetical protein